VALVVVNHRAARLAPGLTGANQLIPAAPDHVAAVRQAVPGNGHEAPGIKDMQPRAQSKMTRDIPGPAAQRLLAGEQNLR
jgi:hypothetical protein